MHPDRVDRGVEFRIFEHRIYHAPLPKAFSGIFIAAHDLYRDLLASQGAIQCLYVPAIVLLFIPDAGIGDVQVMVLFGTLQKIGHIVCHVLRVELPVSDPAGCAPGEGVENDAGISFARFFHQPPLVAAGVIVVVSRAHGAGLCAIGGVHVGAHLYF